MQAAGSHNARTTTGRPAAGRAAGRHRQYDGCRGPVAAGGRRVWFHERGFPAHADAGRPTAQPSCALGAGSGDPWLSCRRADLRRRHGARGMAGAAIFAPRQWQRHSACRSGFASSPAARIGRADPDQIYWRRARHRLRAGAGSRKESKRANGRDLRQSYRRIIRPQMARYSRVAGLRRRRWSGGGV